jgi:hypothetical protein
MQLCTILLHGMKGFKTVLTMFIMLETVFVVAQISSVEAGNTCRRGKGRGKTT